MDKGTNLTVGEKPELRRPHMVCGISGWVDSGAAATGSVRYLARRLKARKFAEIPIARFHIYQVPGQESLRPRVKMEDGLLREHGSPSNQFLYWVSPTSDKDLVLLLGTEPNMNWEEYAEAIFNLASDMAVPRIYLLGGVLDRCPHTKEPHVSCACISPEVKEEMKRYSVHNSKYEGPGSFGTTLMHYCQQRRLDVVSLVVSSTIYPEFNVAIGYNPKAIRALVKRLNHLLGLKLDLTDLDASVKDFEAKIDFTVSQSAQFKAYVEHLEKNFHEVMFEEPLDISGEEAVEMAQEFLRADKNDN